MNRVFSLFGRKLKIFIKLNEIFMKLQKRGVKLVFVTLQGGDWRDWRQRKLQQVREFNAMFYSDNAMSILSRMSRITTVTVKDKIPKNSTLARIFGLRQGFKDKSCPGQEIRETRTRYHSCMQNANRNLLTDGQKNLLKQLSKKSSSNHYS